MPEALVKSQEAKEAIHGTELIAELQKCIERVNLLSDACDDWLRDPDDPNRYFVGARSEDIKVVYEEEKEGKTIRKKAPLSELLARIEGRYTITAVETKHADPRELLLKSYDRLESRLELVAKLLGMINDAPTVNITINPQWLELRAVIVQSLKDYPEARLSVAAALVELEGGTIAR
ncbi:hypothetical protein EON80_28595 [bacterium]|nr:MAG: hypothetical protein EON80_28595 [bacterium]